MGGREVERWGWREGGRKEEREGGREEGRRRRIKGRRIDKQVELEGLGLVQDVIITQFQLLPFSLSTIVTILSLNNCYHSLS